jgi:hypothetical protein
MSFLPAVTEYSYITELWINGLIVVLLEQVRGKIASSKGAVGAGQ